MALEIEGKLIKVLPAVTGEGKNGTWSRQDFVIEVPGQYPYNVCFTLWGDRVSINGFQIGEFVKVSFDVNSREYQEKWFTTLRPWKIERPGAAAPAGAAPAAAAPASEATPLSKQEDDLPF